jgi:hypothetical protein
MIEEVRFSEKSVLSRAARRNIPDHSSMLHKVEAAGGWL